MFTRRHPFLFFILVFTSIVCSFILVMSFMVSGGTKGSEFIGGEQVGVIKVSGVIMDASATLRQLKDLREDDSIKAIVLRIDSPGGAVGPSQEIYREIEKTIKTKKVIASMGSVAASGGYYIASATSGIMANPGTITGSIGVIMAYTNFQEIFKKIGLVPVVIKSGKFKDMGSPLRKMTDSEKDMLQKFVTEIRDQFVRDASKGRKMDQAKMASLADGRIYSGEDAKKIGLIDRLGNFEDAVEWAGRLGGIKGKISCVYPGEKTFSLKKYITTLLNDTIKAAITPAMRAEYLYSPGNQE